MKTRIYYVFDGLSTDRLVRAASKAQAVSHVARSVYDVRVATQDDIVLAVGFGRKVENAADLAVDAEIQE